MKICGFVQTYNGTEHGDIQRCVTNLNRFCDYIVVYDDGSTDGSADFCLENGCDVLRGGSNDFLNETQHKQKLLEFALTLYDDIDWFFWLDDDEILDRNGCLSIRQLLGDAKHDSYSMRELNLWRSEAWERTDYPGRSNFCRAWKNSGRLNFPQSHGLHKCVVPPVLSPAVSEFNVIHYGYSSQDRIEERWVSRNRLGVPIKLSNRHKQFDESVANFQKIPDDLFPEENIPASEPEPPSPAQWSDVVDGDIRYGLKEDYIIPMTLTQRRAHLNSITFKELHDDGIIGNDTLYVGCNNGTSLVVLAPYCKNLTGLDINKNALHVARKHLDDTDNQHVKLICKNLLSFDDQDKYDCVIAYQVMEHIYEKDMKKVLANIHNSLKAGGFFVMEVPHPNGEYYEAPQHVFHFSDKSVIEKVLSPTFEILDIAHETRSNPGPEYPGPHNDWRAICRKL